jgi:hypothetical protein
VYLKAKGLVATGLILACMLAGLDANAARVIFSFSPVNLHHEQVNDVAGTVTLIERKSAQTSESASAKQHSSVWFKSRAEFSKGGPRYFRFPVQMNQITTASEIAFEVESEGHLPSLFSPPCNLYSSIKSLDL